MKQHQLIVLDYLKNADVSPFWAIKQLTTAAQTEDTMLSALVPVHVRKAYIELDTTDEAEVLIALGEYIKKRMELLKR